ncbi:MAG: diaminopimelate decarboxylase [Actinomycetota bacterium]
MPEPDGPWPASACFGPGGLSIGGIEAEELAARFGTPLLVADEEHVRARCRTFADLFPHPLYAVKAFTSRMMVRIAVEEGLNLLVATGGELEACLRAGVPADRIAFHGNNKSDAELDLAARAGIWLVNVDNQEELERLDATAGEAGVVQSVLLRVVPGVGAGAHGAIRTGGPGTKFGMALGAAPAAVRRALELPNIHPVGLHAHIGSQVLEVEPYLRAVDVVLDLLKRLYVELGFVADIVDLGGGFGVAYTDERPLELDELAPALLARIREGAAKRGLLVPHTLVEPGRSVVGTAMVTLYRVGTVKESSGRVLVAVDGGMSDNIRPMLYGARYTVAVAGPPRTGAPAVIEIVGRHCESGDVLARDVRVPHEVRSGDLLAFAATGAYTYSMASNYNRVGRPAVVGVRGDRAQLWVRREDPTDLERLEAPPLPPIAVQVPGGVTVRPAEPRDAESFVRAFASVAAERRFIRTERVTRTAREYRRRFRRSWTNDVAYVMAVEGDRVVGNLSIRRDDHAATRHVAAFGMFVTAEHRRRGIGSALMAEALRWAKSVGVERLELTVYPHNHGAIALYRKFGFAEEGRLVRHSRKSYGYEDEVLMAAWLGPGEGAEGPTVREGTAT